MEIQIFFIEMLILPPTAPPPLPVTPLSAGSNQGLKLEPSSIQRFAFQGGHIDTESYKALLVVCKLKPVHHWRI